MIDRVISRLVSAGADLSSKNAIKAALKFWEKAKGLQTTYTFS